ncbi:hypothetical protein BJ508DRAFT_306368 [Ascobolus immersus RN42]|uniref:Uncharacterized protein n=1 Tax=Ascobolus immersus RN42 TaxID=1160509 RepID=A0A3N4I621_ASCIM|nr:hypothetical protein BJ508DRAFT_306368 [Ascobolus immersus RN42]
MMHHPNPPYYQKARNPASKQAPLAPVFSVNTMAPVAPMFASQSPPTSTPHASFPSPPNITSQPQSISNWAFNAPLEASRNTISAAIQTSPTMSDHPLDLEALKLLQQATETISQLRHALSQATAPKSIPTSKSPVGGLATPRDTPEREHFEEQQPVWRDDINLVATLSVMPGPESVGWKAAKVFNSPLGEKGGSGMLTPEPEPRVPKERRRSRKPSRERSRGFEPYPQVVGSGKATSTTPKSLKSIKSERPKPTSLPKSSSQLPSSTAATTTIPSIKPTPKPFPNLSKAPAPQPLARNIFLPVRRGRPPKSTPTLTSTPLNLRRNAISKPPKHCSTCRGPYSFFCKNHLPKFCKREKNHGLMFRSEAEKMWKRRV